MTNSDVLDTNVKDSISRQSAIDEIYDYMDNCGILDRYWHANEIVHKIEKLPPAQSETDGLDAVKHARQVLWDKCKKYLADHTDEICPTLYGKYQEEYTGMTNEVRAMSRAIYIMEGMKDRGEI